MNRENKFLIHYNNLNTNKISSIRELLGEKNSLEISFDLLNENNLNELDELFSVFKFSLTDFTDTLFELYKVTNLINELNNEDSETISSPVQLLLDSLNKKSKLNIVIRLNMKFSYPTLNIDVKHEVYHFHFRNLLAENEYSVFSLFSNRSVESDKLKYFIRELILKDYILSNFYNISYEDIKDKDDDSIKKFFQLQEILNY